MVITADQETADEFDSTVYRDPDLISSDAGKTADGQATHTVDVWLNESTAIARDGSIYGQRVWYIWDSHDEARAWFNQVIIEHH